MLNNQKYRVVERGQGSGLKAFDVAIFAASTDDADTNKRFAEQLKLDYPVLSDPDKKTAAAYGVLNEKGGYANRWTFYIDKEGTVKYVDQEANKTIKDHGKTVAKKLEELGVPKKQ